MSKTSRPSQPEQLTLSNGIPVILQNYEGAAAATYWWVRTGSADEAPPEAGFAHFLEHMLFKDAAAKETGRASTGQMASAIESLGGDINAYTSFDQTVYHVTCAAHHWERVIDAFGAMAKPQKFLRQDFEREREVILEELRKNEDSPGRQMFQKLFTLTFKKHPYGKPVIGFTRTLKAAKVGNLEAFYKRNYVASKMGLILVGPIGAVGDTENPRRKQIVKLLEKHYGARVIKPAPAPATKPKGKAAASVSARPVEPPLRPGMTLDTRDFDVKTPSVSFSFRVPELAHPDTPALDLLGGILGMGELSRLYQALFYGKSIVTEVSGGAYVPSDPGMLFIQAEMDTKDKILPAVEGIFEQLRKLQDEGPTQEELARVLVNSESEKLYATQTADGIAGRIGFLRYVMGDLDFDRKYLDELRAVTPDRVRQVAREYFDPRRMSGVVLLPKTDNQYDLKPIEAAAKRILLPVAPPEVKPARSATGKRGSELELPVEFFKLPSGIQVAHVERPHSSVFSIHAAVLGGTRLESAEQSGITNLMAQTWSKGTSSKDSRAIARIIEGHASGMDGFSGRNSLGLQLTGLDRDWKVLSDLFAETLTDPQFDEAEIGHSKRVIEDSIKSIEDHSGQLCSRMFLETLFEQHPYGRLSYGSVQTLGKLARADLVGCHRDLIRPDRLVLAVSGPVSRPAIDEWLRDLQSRLAKLPRGTGQIVAAPAAEPMLKAPRWVERSFKREQMHLLVGTLGATIGSPDRFALRLMSNILGGQSGRLFIELREKKSLAYTVSPTSFEGLEPGYIGTYIASAPQKREEAVKGIAKVLEDLAAKGPTPKEMERAREFYLGRRAMDLQSDSSLASHYGLETLYGMPRLGEAALAKLVRAVTAKDVREACRKYLVQPHQVTSVVG